MVIDMFVKYVIVKVNNKNRVDISFVSPHQDRVRVTPPSRVMIR